MNNKLYYTIFLVSIIVALGWTGEALYFSEDEFITSIDSNFNRVGHKLFLNNKVNITNITVSNLDVNANQTITGYIQFDSFSSTCQLYADSDTNTCLSFPAPDVAKITAGGSTDLYLSSIGVGINGFCPLGTDFHVNGSTHLHGNTLVEGNLNVTGNFSVGVMTSTPVYGELYISNNGYKVNYTNATVTFTGSYTNLSEIDMSYTTVTEQAGQPWQQNFTFYNVTGSSGAFMWDGYYFPCSSAHEIFIWAYNGTGFERLTSSADDILCSSGATNSKYLIQFPTNSTRFNIGGNVTVMAEHADAGSGSHRFYTDSVRLYTKDFTPTLPGTHYNLSGGTAGLSSYTTINTNITGITLQLAGIYKVCVATSFRGSPSATLHLDVFANGVQQDKLGFTRKLGSGGDIGSASLCGLYNASAGDVLSLRGEADEGDDWFGFENGNFNVERLN